MRLSMSNKSLDSKEEEVNNLLTKACLLDEQLQKQNNDNDEDSSSMSSLLGSEIMQHESQIVEMLQADTKCLIR